MFKIEQKFRATYTGEEVTTQPLPSWPTASPGTRSLTLLTRSDR